MHWFMCEYSVSGFVTSLIYSVILTEQVKLGQLQRLIEELEEVKKQQQPGATAAETQEGAAACL